MEEKKEDPNAKFRQEFSFEKLSMSHDEWMKLSCDERDKLDELWTKFKEKRTE